MLSTVVVLGWIQDLQETKWWTTQIFRRTALYNRTDLEMLSRIKEIQGFILEER